MTDEQKTELWVAIRPDSNGAYVGTEAAMRERIARELKERPMLPWLLGRMTRRFGMPPLPDPEETLI